MKEKFPITTNIITVLNVIAVLILVFGGITTFGAFKDATPQGILIAFGIGIGTVLSAIVPAFLAEMMKVILEIEKNTRKD